MAKSDLTLSNEFMKCQESETKAASLSGWPAETSNRQVTALSSMYCVDAIQWQTFHSEFQTHIFKHIQSHSSHFTTSCRSNTHLNKEKIFSGFTATVVLKLFRTLKPFCAFSTLLLEVREWLVFKTNPELYKQSTGSPSYNLSCIIVIPCL